MKRMHRYAIGLLMAIVAGSSSAVPIISSTVFHTDRWGTVPDGVAGFTGVAGDDWLHLFTTVSSTDPAGGITATATYGDGLTLPLSPFTAPIASGTNFETFVADLSRTGPWTLTVTDSTGSASASFQAIAEPELLPLLQNVQVLAGGLTPTITWALPDLAGFDADAIQIRVIEAATGSQIFQSANLMLSAANYVLPADILQTGTAYAFRLLLLDNSGGRLENRSNTFSSIYSVPEPGTLALFAAGAFAYALTRRRKSAAQ